MRVVVWCSFVIVAAAAACAPDEPVPPFDDTQAPLPANLPTAAELATSPRADARAELAALVVDDERWLASDATYARVVDDFAAIDAALPDLAWGFAARRIEDTSGVSVSFPYAPDDEMVQASNARARAEAVNVAEALGGRETTGDNDFAATWPARLQQDFIRETFGAIAGVQYAYAGIRENNGDGHTVMSEQYDVDGKNVWLMVTFGGDCPEGCTEFRATRVRADISGGSVVVDRLDDYDGTEGRCPEWLRDRVYICSFYEP